MTDTPEYKIGDIVKIFDGTHHINIRGFIYDKTESNYHIAIERFGTTTFLLSSGRGHFLMRIVGLSQENVE